MKNVISVITVIILMLFSVGFTGYGATWESCDQWATWSDGGYNLYNNIWGSDAGEQCIWANSYSNWGVWADHPDTSGVKSYPNCEMPEIDTRISELQSLTSSFNCTVPDDGSYCTSYDIWSGRRYEIMLWMNKQGSVGPWADQYDEYGNPVPRVSNIDVGGHTWDAYYNGGVNGRHVISLLRTTNTDEGTVDILACLNWIKDQGWFGDIIVEEVQLGFEITSSSGGMDFTMNSYSVQYSTSSASVPAAPSNLAAMVIGPESLDLAWTDNAVNEDGFCIERSFFSGSGFSEIDILGANETSYQDTGLATGTAYYYRVRAFNVSGYSEYSNEACGIPMPLGSGTGLKADYFDNADFTNLVFTRIDASVNFDWGDGSPDPAIEPDTFSVRWTGYVEPLYSETYTFKTFSDDGDRLWVDGVQLTDNWKTQHGGEISSGEITLSAGQKYIIELEFYENSGGAAIQLFWSSASQTEEIIPITQLYP